MKSFRCYKMPTRQLFNIEAEELKLGSENLPTLEQVLKHGVFLKVRKYQNNIINQGPNEKWELINYDVAQKLHQIWIQDFGIPERCFLPEKSLKQKLKNLFDRLSTHYFPRLDLQKNWMTKFGTIF